MKQQMTYSRADVWLFIAISAYFVMNGAQLWETVIMVPAWTAEPPASLIHFQGPYRIESKMFWVVLHSAHEFLFLLGMVFNWNVPRRRIPFLLLFIAHVAVRAWTLMYFAPISIEFRQMPYSTAIDPALVEKAAAWRNLNYLRVGIFLMINLSLIPLFKVNSKYVHQAHNSTIAAG